MMVAATTTTSSQKTTRAPSTSEGSRRGRQERLNSNPNQVSLSTEKFAGRLRHFLPAWSSITTDQNILDIVQHYHLEIETPNQSRPRPEIQFESNEKEIIASEITHLFKLGVIEPAVHSPGEYISTIFVRKKKSGKISHDFESQRAQ